LEPNGRYIFRNLVDMSHVHQISNECPTNFGGGTMQLVSPQLKLWGGTRPPLSLID